MCVGVAEPVWEVGVEFGDLAGGEDEILVAEDYPQPSVEDIQPVVPLVCAWIRFEMIGQSSRHDLLMYL